MGVRSAACKRAKLNRDTFYRYMEDDPVFRQKVEDTDLVAFDYGMTKLLQLIRGGNVQATLGLVRLLAPKRGIHQTMKIVGKVHNLNEDVNRMSEQEIDNELSELEKLL